MASIVFSSFEGAIQLAILNGFLSPHEEVLQTLSKTIRATALRSQGFEGVLARCLRKGFIQSDFNIRAVSKTLCNNGGMLVDSHSGATPLMCAVSLTHHASCVNVPRVLSLLENESYRKSASCSDHCGNTALHDAVYSAKLTKRLLEIGCNPNAACQRTGATPLHHACLEADGDEQVTLLLESGADPLICDNVGHKAQDWDSMFGRGRYQSLLILAAQLKHKRSGDGILSRVPQPCTADCSSENFQRLLVGNETSESIREVTENFDGIRFVSPEDAYVSMSQQNTAESFEIGPVHARLGIHEDEFSLMTRVAQLEHALA
jgi:hypothetical protein